MAAMMRENIRPATVRAAGHIGAETDLRPVLPSVDVPTLVLHGEADARSPLANAESLRAAIATSQLVVLPALGVPACELTTYEPEVPTNWGSLVRPAARLSGAFFRSSVVLTTVTGVGAS